MRTRPEPLPPSTPGSLGPPATVGRRGSWGPGPSPFPPSRWVWTGRWSVTGRVRERVPRRAPDQRAQQVLVELEPRVVDGVACRGRDEIVVAGVDGPEGG